MTFIDKLNYAIKNNQSLLCVGLDLNENNLTKVGSLYEHLITWVEGVI
jgi:hypothetical protein